MKASLEIIILGNDILNGSTIDEFSYWIGKNLNEEGIIPTRIVVMRMEDLKAEVQSIILNKKFKAVIIAAEFEPYSSDPTLNYISRSLKRKLLPSKTVVGMIKEETLQVTARKTPVLPESAEPIENPKGLVPGFKLIIEDCVVYVLPRKIEELRWMIKNSVAPNLRKILL